uniref:Methyltransferase domain-containing protein n=1 Tax=Phytophthora ramorum TaxID=164328 RepID=H3H395_PHYRM
MVTENALELHADRKVVFQEKQGQQAKVWDCALVLAKFLANDAYFPQDFFLNKRVIELGCGVGVPGLAAAALGAKKVVLTDMSVAIPWIQANIELNQTRNYISSDVRAESLMWGENEALEMHQFDVILCSDLVYGERSISQKLVQTIVQLSHPKTLVVSAHEARFAGDRGESFFTLLSEQHFRVEQVPRERLDAVYSAANMHVHMIRPTDVQ